MKHFLTLAIFCFAIIGCNKETIVKPVCEDDIDERCECPELTHHTLDLDQLRCLEKKDNRFLAEFSGNNCLRGGTFDAFDKIGYGNIYFPYTSVNKNGLTLYFGPYNTINSEAGFVDFSLNDNENGSHDVEFKYYHLRSHYRCLDWAERTDCPLIAGEGVIGHFKGKSNPDRTKYEFDIEWIDCHDVVLDTGHLSLWQ